jgi:hypothetical protein
MRQRTSTAQAQLDANHDTTELATAEHLDEASPWRIHLDYLRDLQRTGRELLAHTDPRP